MSKLVIAYHKDCMDGVSSAFIVRHAYCDRGYEIVTIPLQYGSESELDSVQMDEDTYVIFADFSLKRDALIELSKKVKCISIFDHHKTAKAELVDLPENVDTVFDMDRSGAMICLKEYSYWLQPSAEDEIFEYIQDRDLWQWKLPDSQAISEFLKLKVKPNDIDSFEQVYNTFNKKEAIEVGRHLLQYQRNQVKAKALKARDLTFEGIEMKVINATENISELGNEICSLHGKPALLYFVLDDNSVVCSMRSLFSLEDVSTIATKYGGGGHRNACGFKTTLKHLAEILGEQASSTTFKIIVRNPSTMRQMKKKVYESKEKFDKYGEDITRRALRSGYYVEQFSMVDGKWKLFKEYK